MYKLLYPIYRSMYIPSADPRRPWLRRLRLALTTQQRPKGGHVELGAPGLREAAMQDLVDAKGRRWSSWETHEKLCLYSGWMWLDVVRCGYYMFKKRDFSELLM